eukprot:2551610-Pleurochrysis_carterae.AAC.1
MVSGVIQRTFWGKTTGFLGQYNRAFGDFWSNTAGFLGYTTAFLGEFNRFLEQYNGVSGVIRQGFWGNPTGSLWKYNKISGGFWGNTKAFLGQYNGVSG